MLPEPGSRVFIGRRLLSSDPVLGEPRAFCHRCDRVVSLSIDIDLTAEDRVLCLTCLDQDSLPLGPPSVPAPRISPEA